MVTKSNAWWMTRTKGIYIFSASPFRQKAFSGFFTEMRNLLRLHWKGVLYFGSLTAGGWSLMKWANSSYHQSLRKDSAFFDAEDEGLRKSSLTEIEKGEVKEGPVEILSGKSLGADTAK